MWRNRPNEGVLIRLEDIQQFLTDFERLNHSEETVQFYRRKMKRFYEDLPEVTVETVEAGKVIFNKNKYKRLVTIPSRLKKELLDFARRKGILSGPIFQTRDRRPMCRTFVLAIICGVCEKARIPCGQATLQALRKLYSSTRHGVESNVALLVEQDIERMMEQERLSIWMGRRMKRREI